MAFTHLHREAQLALVDVYDDTDIHVRYSVAHLPANTPRIITSNRGITEIVMADDPAIRRRIQVVSMNMDTGISGKERKYQYVQLI